MNKHILIRTVGSEVATHGAEHGRANAVLLQDYKDGQQEAALQIQQAYIATAGGLGLKASALRIPDAPPAEAILSASLENTCDLICMTSHWRRGIMRLVGSPQAAEMASSANMPVLIMC